MTDPLHSPASNLLAELGLDARHGAVAAVERYGREMRATGHADALLHLRGEVHDAACGGDGLTGAPPSNAEMVAFERVVALIDKLLARGPLPESCAQTQINRANHALPTAGERRAPRHCGECRFHQRDAAGDETCGKTNQRIWPDDPERPEWCPLAKSEQRGEDAWAHSFEPAAVGREKCLRCGTVRLAAPGCWTYQAPDHLGFGIAVPRCIRRGDAP